MCLSMILPIPEKYADKQKVFTGYKVFMKFDGRITPPYYLSTLPLKRWKKDELRYKKVIYINSNMKYRAGFHIFVHKRDAFNFQCRGEEIRKVKFKNVCAFGEQSGNFVIVAREILVGDIVKP